MGKTSSKTYVISGKRYRFDRVAFDRSFRGAARARGLSLERLAVELGEAVFVSSKTVKAWRYGPNSPGDAMLVEGLSAQLGEDVRTFLVEEGADDMRKLDERQKDAALRVYTAISDFLYMLDQTDGCVWKGYRIAPGSPWASYLPPSPGGPGGAPVIDGADLARAGHSWVLHVLERECVVLGAHPAYSDLCELVDGPLLGLWDGRTDPDLRFHPAEGDDAPAPTVVAVEKAAREIVSKYL